MQNQNLVQYINEINKYPLLKSEEERIIGSIKDGNPIDPKDYPTFNSLTTNYSGTDQEKARECLINSNLRLVIYIAKNYKDRAELTDLISAGNLGLLRAVKKFDASKGFRFSTYAARWIQQFIINEINGSTLIHIPSYLIEAENKYESIEDAVDVRPEFLEKSIESRNVVSIDAAVGMSLPTHDKEYTDLPEIITNMLASLSKKERELIILRKLMEREEYRKLLPAKYQKLPKENLSLQKIGDMYNLSRESIRIKQRKIINKLRRNYVELKRQAF